MSVIYELLKVIIMTFLPIFELRLSIPYGISQGLNPYLVFIVAVLANILTAIFAYFLFQSIIHLFLKIKFINKLYEKRVKTTQKKLEPFIQKYGKFGLALFIGVPLPFSGVYTGALGAKLLNINLKDFLIASIIGVFIAGILILLISSGVLVLSLLF